MQPFLISLSWLIGQINRDVDKDDLGSDRLFLSNVINVILAVFALDGLHNPVKLPLILCGKPHSGKTSLSRALFSLIGTHNSIGGKSNVSKANTVTRKVLTVFTTAQLERRSALSTMPFCVDDAGDSAKVSGNLREMIESAIHVTEEAKFKLA